MVGPPYYCKKAKSITMQPNQSQTPAASTGPRTDAGKFASSKNALKHGLTSESIDRFPEEIRDAYQAFLAQSYAEFQPQTLTETDYLEQYAFNRFLYQRGQVMLASVYTELTADPSNEILEKRYAKLSRHVKALDRLANQALKELRTFISDRLHATELASQLPDCAAGLPVPPTFPSHRLLAPKAQRLAPRHLTLRFVQDQLSRMPAPDAAGIQPEKDAA